MLKDANIAEMADAFEKIAKEHKVWSLKNFGEQKTIEPILGLWEEFGELSHAHLKSIQGIRRNENHREMKIDAVGDIAIYLINLCNITCADIRKGIACAVSATKYIGPQDAFNIMLDLSQNIAGISLTIKRVPYDPIAMTRCIEEYAGFIIFWLAAYSEKEGFDFLHSIQTTWDSVKNRDWTKNNIDGSTHQISN